MKFTHRTHCIPRRAAMAVLLGAASWGSQAAETWPQQPLRLIVPFGAGGVTDTTARVFADGISKQLGQPVIVENRPGAGGSIAAGMVAKSKPDGYTLLVVTNGIFAVNPHIYPQLPYNPSRDFSYIAMLANTPNILAVSANSPYTSLQAVIDAAAKGEEKISFATAGEGSDNYQILQLLQQATHTKWLHVPYKSGTESLTAVMGGTADATAISAATSQSFIKSRQIRAFAVTSARRLADQPDIPTVKEVLGKSIEGGSLSGIAAPAGTPDAVLQRLNAAITQVARSDAAKDKVFSRGSEPVDTSQEAFQARVKQEQAKWAAILKPGR
ncbi:Bug family tripartite tricarboxylate transporter substrate binding protein [Comamonas sp. GB3 AK4-5]|uniref:Bug family tripartite tricarboxylate transporter substrate binding protein n=1 Tax=Comamonas sp. GB3 AK4-5 TaxID=3231487 RepID=UPI00351EE426